MFLIGYCFLSVVCLFSSMLSGFNPSEPSQGAIGYHVTSQGGQKGGGPLQLPAGLEAARNMFPRNRNFPDQSSTQYTQRQQLFLADIKNNLSNMTYQQITNKYHGDLQDPVIKKCYDQLTTFLFSQKNIQNLVARDPEWRRASKKERKDVNFQSCMLMRLYYQYELEQNIGFENFSTAARDFLYDIAGELDDIYGDQKQCSEEMYFSFIHKASVEIDRYPLEVQQFYCHRSGVLKSFIHHPYIQQHFLHHHISSPGLRHSINYAACTTCSDMFLSCEILRAAFLALDSASPEYRAFYEQRAVDLYHECNPADYKSYAPPLTSLYLEEFYHLKIDPSLDQRVLAYERAKANNFAERAVKYQFSPQVKGFMMSQGMNPTLFSSMKGNELQHQILGELFEIMEESADHEHPLTPDLADFVDIAQNYNVAKSLENSMTCTDICWNIFEYGKAVVMGCYDTLDGIAEIVLHPVDSLISCGKNLGKLAIGLEKGIVGTCKYGYNSFYDPASARLAEQQFMDGLRDLKDRFEATSGPDRVRFATHMITDFFCTGKALGAIGKIAAVSGKRAYDFAKLTAAEFIELSRTERVFAQTATGDLMIAFCEGGESVAQTAKKIIQPSWTAFVAEHLPCLKKIEKEIELLAKELGTTTTNLLGREMEAVIDLEHIFLPQAPTVLKNSRIRGFHHDFCRYLEKSGKLDIVKKAYKQGCVLAEAAWTNGKKSTKTFFSPTMSRREVVMKIREALSNAVLETSYVAKKMEAAGYTNDGMRIIFYIEEIDNKVKITSAFPCKDWLSGLK